MDQSKKCLSCGSSFKGRSDKKFCDPYCKSAFHYQKNQQNLGSFYSRVDKQLKVNRAILKRFNKAGKATVRSEILLELDFNPRIFTHYWKNNSGDVYLFVFEFGFLKKLENGKQKYILITWQSYMETNLNLR